MSAHILGIDPGRNKFGAALLDRFSKKIIYRRIIRFREFARDPSGAFSGLAVPLAETVREAAAAGCVESIALGDGTFSDDYRRILDSILKSDSAYSKISVFMVSEKGTTEEGRNIYRTENPPFFPFSLLPSSIIPVFAEVDDYAAAAIARRLATSDGG